MEEKITNLKKDHKKMVKIMEINKKIIEKNRIEESKTYDEKLSEMFSDPRYLLFSSSLSNSASTSTA